MEDDRSYAYTGLGRRVIVSDGVWQVWGSHRQFNADDPEACGVLIGWTSLDRKTLHIEAITEPLPGDQQSRYRFELLDPGHQKQVETAYQASGQTMIYLGTWHSHPESEPTPSSVDKADWRRCMQRNENRALAFAIVGTAQINVYVPWGHWFRSLTRETTC